VRIATSSVHSRRSSSTLSQEADHRMDNPEPIVCFTRLFQRDQTFAMKSGFVCRRRLLEIRSDRRARTQAAGNCHDSPPALLRLLRAQRRRHANRNALSLISGPARQRTFKDGAERKGQGGSHSDSLKADRHRSGRQSTHTAASSTPPCFYRFAFYVLRFPFRASRSPILSNQVLRL